MNIKGVMMQFFEWYMPAGKHWTKMAEESARLVEEGISALWIPPPYKGTDGLEDVGYAVYDRYDLGEFDQKGSVETRYGSKDELIRAIKTAHDHGLEIYADIVLNHMMGADSRELVEAEEFNPDNRHEKVSDLKRIEANTHFYFPGRQRKYSDFQWHWYHFTGIDYDQKKDQTAIFKFRGKYWEQQVDQENGNYEYLMGASLDLSRPEVREELKRWGKWFMETTGIDGFRLDAIKHMEFAFYGEWLNEIREFCRKECFTVGEYWSEHLDALTNYLSTNEWALSLFDVPLHSKFYQASKRGADFDLRSLFEGTLTSENPLKSTTFVDNHDTQPGQSLESWVEDWFKPLAYSVILLRNEGYPCIFYGDYYGIENNRIAPKKDMLRNLLSARINRAHGERHDYVDDKNLIGWTCEGDDEHPGSGLAVLLTNSGPSEKQMMVGRRQAGAAFIDLMGGLKEPVTIDEEGRGLFKVNGGSVSVWGRRDALK